MAIFNTTISGGGTAPAHYIEKAVDANGVLINASNIIDLTGITDVGDYVLYYAYYNNTAISGAVDMSDLTAISGNTACGYGFYGCTGITSVNLSSLTTISGQSACYGMFNGTGITSVNLPALTTISERNACYSMFQNCPGITSANLPALTTISGSQSCCNMFQSCTSLATVYIGGTTAIDFGTYTNQFNNMFKNCTQNIDVYAPAANQTQIESFSGYPNFGGTGNVVWHWNTAE